MPFHWPFPAPVVRPATPGVRNGGGSMNRLFALPLLAVVLLAVPASGEFPFPANPNRCDSSGLPLGCIPLPNEMSGGAGSCNGEKWKYASTNFCTTDPAVDGSPNELLGVSGMSVEIAWRLETGRPDVVIAVHDSGIKWNDGGDMSQLRRKLHLNPGELPAPNPVGGCHAPMGGDPRDCNGDGVFNMPDYDGDPAVVDMNGNGITDPEDLIILFSNGVDDDGNGYVDDISGYDFFEFDNDPFDEVQYGHGTGEAEDSTAEANNGGDLGACPNCMVMPVRIGDSFVADVNSFAQGVVFSVDTGAAVIQEALGTYNQSKFAQQAIDYAYAHGLPVMASAADEDSWHHVFPGPYVHTIMVNAIADFGVPTEPNSWLFLNGCTNFGGNLQVSVSATSCSSEATGRSSGIAGLIVSAGRDAVDAHTLTSPLTANEIRQVITRTADDINFDVPGGPAGTPPSTGGRTVAFPDTSRYATQAGFDQFTGYGRINAHSAVARVLAGQIPPEADVTKPVWFQLLDPERDGPFTVEGRLAAERAPGGYTYRVQIGYGVQPVEADFIDIVTFGATRTTPLQGVLATITPADIPAPIRGAILASVAIGDIDGDGYLDVVAADMEGKVYAWDHQGVLKAGFPVHVNYAYSTHAVRVSPDEHSDNRVDRAIVASPALADLDGDGGLDIIVGANDRHLYVWDGFGNPRAGFPVVVADPTRVSIDPGTHKVTPLAGTCNGSPGPANCAFRGEKIMDSPAIGDIDHDASLSSGTSMAVAELLAASGSAHPANTRVYAIHKDGNNHGGGPFLPGWPAKIAFFTAEILPDVGEGINASPALADVDGNGTLETGVFSAAGPAYLLNADGTSFYGSDSSGNYRVMQTEGGSSTSPDMPSIPSIGEGAFGDLTGSGQLSFAAPAAGIGRLLAIVLADQQLTADDHIDAWLATTGNFQPSFPHHMEDLQFLTGASIADVGGGPTAEIVEGSAGYFLHAYDVTGTEPTGWPKFTGGWHVANAAIGDVDGDGLNEVVALTREGNLYVWDTTAPAGAQQWPKKRHDLRNTGNYNEPQGLTGIPTTTTTSTTLPGGTTSTTTTTTSTTTTTVPGFTGTLDVRRARMKLPDGPMNDRLTLTGFLSLGAGSDGIDPTRDGFSLVLTGVRFDIPGSAFTGSAGRWRYRDPNGLGSNPDGITSVIVRRQRDGRYRINVRGRNMELSTFDGTTDRTVQVRVEIGNDRAAANLTFRRVGRDLRYP